jgi:hypothetical protein
VAERKVRAPGSGTTRRSSGRAEGPKQAAAPPPRAEGQSPLCTVAFCPICLAVTAIGDARPELVEHLMVAGREMLLAARAVIDARLQSMDQEPSPPMQRVTIE